MEVVFSFSVGVFSPRVAHSISQLGVQIGEDLEKVHENPSKITRSGPGAACAACGATKRAWCWHFSEITFCGEMR